VLVIVLTRLNRSRFAVNPDLIERIQELPDTTLIMVDGATFVVAESMDAVIDAVVAFRARVLTAALGTPVTPAPEAPLAPEAPEAPKTPPAPEAPPTAAPLAPEGDV
jgi:flagellar protein FlbD